MSDTELLRRDTYLPAELAAMHGAPVAHVVHRNRRDEDARRIASNREGQRNMLRLRYGR